MKTKRFNISSIISAGTSCLVGPIDEVYEILNFMTGDDLYTHQLPRAGRECRDYIYDQFPWLNDIDLEKARQENGQSWDKWHNWVDRQAKQYGEFHEVSPIPMDDHDIIDPIDELEQMVDDPSKIVIIDPTESDKPNDIGDINWKVD